MEAAAEASVELADMPKTDFRPLVGKLSRQECDVFLCRIAQGETSAVMELKKRLLSFVPSPPVGQGARRSIGQLLSRMRVIQDARDQLQKEEARIGHAAEMEALQARETDIWSEVESLIEMKQPKQYDAAIIRLSKLKELSEFRHTAVAFRKQVEVLCERYRKRSGFKCRVEKAKLFDEQPKVDNQADVL